MLDIYLEYPFHTFFCKEKVVGMFRKLGKREGGNEYYSCIPSVIVIQLH